MISDGGVSRRIALRRLLLVGSGLCLLPVYSACERNGGANGAPSGKRMTQAGALYQNHPWGRQHCGNCLSFVPESNTCKVVEGEVSAEGWCALWTIKA